MTVHAILGMVAFAASVLTSASPTDAAALVPSPTVEGPVSGGAGAPILATTSFDLGELGYEQHEYFVSGTASAFTATGPLASDGRWTAAPATSAPYKTRIVVYRPAERRRFNGSVVVEWLNVSSLLDAAGDWITAHTELMREGYAYVGVSAQQIGVEGGISIIGVPFLNLKRIDPARYGSLVHPGDSFSYDIFSQVGQAIRKPAGPSPLGELRAKRLIAAGYSQSAHRLVTYVNAIHPLAGMYDGYLLHGRPVGAMPLSQRPQAAIAMPVPARIREDLDARVLIFQSETDLITLRAHGERQPDGKRVRTWEVAGTAHVDTYTYLVGPTDKGDSPENARMVVGVTSPAPRLACTLPVNSGPQHFVYKAAIAALNRWVARGKPPRSAPPLEITPGPPPAIARDEHGNALGGVRTPQLDAPIATLSGLGNGPGFSCGLFGTTTPFDAATLAQIYGDPEAYVSAFRKATRRALRAGFIRPADARLLKAAAKPARF